MENVITVRFPRLKMVEKPHQQWTVMSLLRILSGLVNRNQLRDQVQEETNGLLQKPRVINHSKVRMPVIRDGEDNPSRVRGQVWVESGNHCAGVHRWQAVIGVKK